MVGLLLSLMCQWAVAGDRDQTLVWDLSMNDQPVGERTVTVKYFPALNGTRRIFESFTTAKVSVIGAGFELSQRLTAHAADGPASFHSVMDLNGSPRELQARQGPMGWVVTVVERGRTRTWEMERDQIDFTTADLVDPETRFPLKKYETAHILSAETGNILDVTVRDLGSSDLVVDGRSIPVQHYAWTSESGPSEFFYTSDGILVRYETTLGEHRVVAHLRQLPPPGLDERPIPVAGAGVSEMDL